MKSVTPGAELFAGGQIQSRCLKTPGGHAVDPTRARLAESAPLEANDVEPRARAERRDGCARRSRSDDGEVGSHA